MAYSRELTHIFVDMDGQQIDLDINTQYRVIETIFIADSTTHNGSVGVQEARGRLFHKVAPATVIHEE